MQRLTLNVCHAGLEPHTTIQVTHSGANVQAGKSGGQAQGTSKALTTFIDPSLNWDDIPWFQSITKMRIILKGIGSAEDAVQAYKAGCAGVLLSNHGGRQLDFARAAIEVLPEVMEALREIDYDASKFEVGVTHSELCLSALCCSAVCGGSAQVPGRDIYVAVVSSIWVLYFA